MMLRMISFFLTWDWAANLQREAMRQNHPDLDRLMEEIMPFTSDMFNDMVPAVDDQDLKA